MEQEDQPASGVIRSLSLPRDLQAAVTRALAAVPASRWLQAAQDLSERYRAPREASGQALVSGPVQVLGYAALLLPATYAQLRGAMAAAAARIPEWQPQTMLDLGSGPGTALWAAIAQWPGLKNLSAWERDEAFIGLGRALARESEAPVLRETRWQRVDLMRSEAGPRRYDLVVVGHVLNEVAETQRAAVLAQAWELTAGLLLLVEPGTSSGFAIIRSAREQLLAAGAQTIAPCAHNQACPLVNDWCHFPQRLIRPEFQRRARGAPSQWEDAKYAYAAMARFAVQRPIWGRVIREVSSNKAYAEAIISTVRGVLQVREFKRQRERYRGLRELDWGAAVEREGEWAGESPPAGE